MTNLVVFKISLRLEGGREVNIYQPHATREDAWKTGETILNDEFCNKGEVIRARMLSGLESRVFLRGHSIDGLNNEKLEQLDRK